MSATVPYTEPMSQMPGRILTIDDVATRRMMLKARLCAAAYEVEQATSLGEATAMLRSPRFGLVILSDGAGSAGEAADFCQRLATAPGAPPVLALGGTGTAGEDAAARLRALAAGAADWLGRPCDAAVLLARVRSLLRQGRMAGPGWPALPAGPASGLAEAAAPPPAAPGVIALVSASPQELVAWRSRLSRCLPGPLAGLRPPELFQGLRQGPLPDAILLSAGDGRPETLRLLAELKARPETAAIPVLVVGAGTSEQAIMALDLGAQDVLPAGFDPEELALRLRHHRMRRHASERQRQEVAEQLRLAATDPLTGLANRRTVFQSIEALRQQAVRRRESYAVMVLDLDRFKQVNDRWGHAAGDRVLADIAARLAQTLRGRDLVGRIGGEEFLVALPCPSLAEAQRTAERLRREVEAQPVALPGGGDIKVTLSIGLCLSDGAESVAGAVARADRALYCAKARGRNTVTLDRPAA